jgi:hypothetical protein
MNGKSVQQRCRVLCFLLAAASGYASLRATMRAHWWLLRDHTVVMLPPHIDLALLTSHLHMLTKFCTCAAVFCSAVALLLPGTITAHAHATLHHDAMVFQGIPIYRGK